MGRPQKTRNVFAMDEGLVARGPERSPLLARKAFKNGTNVSFLREAADREAACAEVGLVPVPAEGPSLSLTFSSSRPPCLLRTPASAARLASSLPRWRLMSS